MIDTEEISLNLIIRFAPQPPILGALLDACSPKLGGWGADGEDVLSVSISR